MSLTGDWKFTVGASLVSSIGIQGSIFQKWLDGVTTFSVPSLIGKYRELGFLILSQTCVCYGDPCVLRSVEIS